MDDPKHIGRYEILGELGRGAMGRVYRAQDPNIGRIVALKTMRLDVHGSDDVEVLRRFKHEAKLAGVLNHGNIVTIYDAGEFEGVFYMAMEYLEGSTLQTLLHKHRTLPPERILEISRQVCAGLDYAHAHQVIHRDVKPANIMMTADNVAKIMDFGIAKSGANMTTTGQVLGTPTYMSPEQVRGKTLDGRTDLFSFGVVLYEMVVGEKPFTGQTITTIIYKIIHEPAIPPMELDVTVHPGISAVIMKALAKNPAERYQTGADLVRDLLRYESLGSEAGSEAGPAKVAAAASPNIAPANIAPANVVPVNVAPANIAPANIAPANIAPANVAPANPAPVKAEPQPPPKPAPKKESPRAVPVTSGENTMAVGLRIGNRPPAVKVAPPPANRNVKIAAIAGGAVLALILLAVALGWLRKPATEAKPDASSTPETAAPAVVAPPATVKGKASSPPAGGAKATKTSAAAPVKTAVVEAPKTSAMPAAVAAIPADKGNLQISSDPAGAKVVISGPTPANGTTPFNATGLEPGTYSITLSKPGFASVTRNVRVMGGRAAAVGVDLKEETGGSGKLVINSTPAGAEIFLDGKSTGKVTPAQFPASNGEHKIELRKDGYHNAETTATVKNGESHTFAPTLEAAKSGGGNPFRGFRGLFGGNKIPEGKGMVNFKTNPSGADLFHNGVKVDKPTPAKFPMDPGTYKVTIRKDGYKARVQEFTVEKGKSVDVNVTLEKN